MHHLHLAGAGRAIEGDDRDAAAYFEDRIFDLAHLLETAQLARRLEHVMLVDACGAHAPAERPAVLDDDHWLAFEEMVHRGDVNLEEGEGDIEADQRDDD